MGQAILPKYCRFRRDPQMPSSIHAYESSWESAVRRPHLPSPLGCEGAFPGVANPSKPECTLHRTSDAARRHRGATGRGRVPRRVERDSGRSARLRALGARASVSSSAWGAAASKTISTHSSGHAAKWEIRATNPPKLPRAPAGSPATKIRRPERALWAALGRGASSP